MRKQLETAFVLREMQMKTSVKYLYVPMTVPLKNKQTLLTPGKGVGKENSQCWRCEMGQPFWNTVG